MASFLLAGFALGTETSRHAVDIPRVEQTKLSSPRRNKRQGTPPTPLPKEYFLPLSTLQRADNSSMLGFSRLPMYHPAGRKCLVCVLPSTRFCCVRVWLDLALLYHIIYRRPSNFSAICTVALASLHSLGSPNSTEDAVDTGLELVDGLHRGLVPALVLVSLALRKRRSTVPHHTICATPYGTEQREAKAA